MRIITMCIIAAALMQMAQAATVAHHTRKDDQGPDEDEQDEGETNDHNVHTTQGDRQARQKRRMRNEKNRRKAYDVIAIERYCATDEVDIVRAYEIIDSCTAHPEYPGPARAYAHMPYDSMRPICDSGIAMQLLHAPKERQPEMLPI